MKKDAAEMAVSRFMSGFNCAESVFLSVAEFLEVESPLIPKAATPFGGGIARKGMLCGCIAGGVMGIGLKHGRLKLEDDREKAYEITVQFLEAFKEKFGSFFCCELVGCDFNTEEGAKKFERLKRERCANFVRESVKVLTELLE